MASLVGYLRTRLRLPFRAIQRHLARLHSRGWAWGELVKLLHAVRQLLQFRADALKGAVQTSTATHGDETIRRENGRNGYAWNFVTAGVQTVRSRRGAAGSGSSYRWRA